MRLWGLVWLVLSVVLLLPGSGVAEALLYPQPPEMKRSSAAAVTVDGKSLDVLQTAVNHTRTWTSRPITAMAPVGVFELRGSAQVTVRFPGLAIESAVVRPLALGITPSIQGDTLSFSLEGPAYLVIEINGDPQTALHLFADAPDENPPNTDDPSVIYLGPGIHERRTIALTEGQTLYLAPGAILRGQVVAHNAQNIRIAGHGIIDGSTFDRWDDTLVPIDLSHCRNVSVEGVLILDPSAWTLNAYFCEDVRIEGVKIIGARSNSDGITTQSCRRLTARNCFVRGWDDNLVVKGYDGDVSDILFEDCILWTDLAQSCEIGYETRAQVIQNVVFRGITILHNFHKPALSIHNSDSALVKGVRFEDITIEDAQMGEGDGAKLLIELTTTKSQWSKTPERGNIRDVTFKGIRVLSGKDLSFRIFAFSKEATIDDVVFADVTVLGREIHGWEDVRLNKNNKIGDNIRWE